MATKGLVLTSQPPSRAEAPVMSVGGIMPVMGNAALDKIKAERQAALRATEVRPEITGLAGYIDRAWTTSRQFVQMNVQRRLLDAQRRRNGIYDDETLGLISEQGGSQVWMHITAAKCRAASAQLRDALLGTGSEKPWTLEPTPVPDISPDVQEALIQAASLEIQRFQELNGGVMPPDEEVRALLQEMKDRTLEAAREQARIRTDRMASKMEDQQVEGGWLHALNAFIDDLCTYPFAVMKGPVIRRRATLSWQQTADGYAPVAGEELRMEWYRVSPFDVYWAPHAEKTEDGYLIERIRYTREELNALIGVEGYNEDAINKVLREFGEGGLREWTQGDNERSEAEGKGGSAFQARGPENVIEALEFHGGVMGQMLLDWGMSAEQIPEPEREYMVCAVKIGDHVIRAQLNYDPLRRKPYYKSCYESIPGQWCGNSVPDLIRDDQDMCNSAARALANNMGLSSGPQVAMNVDRLPDGEDVTQMYPWKIWQFTNDPMGSTAQPIQFFAPPSLAAELMGVYEKFSLMADEHSGVPRYMQGDTNMGTIGRSATGVTAVMGAASKIIKQVVLNVDIGVLQPALEYQYYYNMKYLQDPDLKGDVKIRARGATSMIQKEAAQVRRNEFLQLVLNSPVVAQVIGEQGIAEMLRQTGKTLDFMNIDRIIPTPAELQRRLQMQQMLQLQAAQAEAAQVGGPTSSIQAKYDDQGQFIGADVMPPQRALPNGAPVANNFQTAGQG